MAYRTRADAIAFESRLGHWPRRLLKIEANKLTSCEWKEGNVYGGVKAPPYVAISYTWGRFELKQNERMEIAPLEIKGEDGMLVPWKIPRIDPAKFTTEQIHTLLRRITMGPKLAFLDNSSTTIACSHLDEFSAEPQIQFVWLDIACIDQRDDSPEKLLEIGRQAVIFRGAYQCYVWLYHHEPTALDELLSLIDQAYAISLSLPSPWNGHIDRGPLTDAEMNWLPNTVKLLKALNEDPYFSSLWTLQEAFLCSEARLVTKNAHIMIRVRAIPAYSSTGKDIIHNKVLSVENVGSTLSQLALQIGISQQSRGLDPLLSTNTGLEQELVDLVNAIGLSVCNTSNAMELYGVTRGRVTTERFDTIYAIQQVFDVRVGCSAPDLDVRNDLSLMDLEYELGSKILQNKPIQSMCFIHNDEVEFGKRWYISRWSKVPSPLPFAWTSPMQLSCTISLSNISSGLLLAKFKGNLCLLKRLARSWDRVGSTMRNWPSEYNEVYRSIPAGEEWDSPWLLQFDLGRGMGGFRAPDASFSAFEKHVSADETLRVLHFARASQEALAGHTNWWNIGLVLKPRVGKSWLINEDVYERVGVTVWRSGVKLDENSPKKWPTRAALISAHTGQGQQWIEATGFFG